MAVVNWVPDLFLMAVDIVLDKHLYWPPELFWSIVFTLGAAVGYIASVIGTQRY